MSLSVPPLFPKRPCCCCVYFFCFSEQPSLCGNEQRGCGLRRRQYAFEAKPINRMISDVFQLLANSVCKLLNVQGHLVLDKGLWG